MPRRPLKILPALLALILAWACAALAAPAATSPLPVQKLILGSPAWDTEATRQSQALGGLALERPFPGEGLAAVFTGKAPGALVSHPLSLEPGALYRLRLSLRRQDFVNDHYLWLNLWGVEHRLDAHCLVNGWQEVVVEGEAPADGKGVVAIRNHGTSRLMARRVALEKAEQNKGPGYAQIWPRQPFPWGVYLSSKDMSQAAALGFNTVITGAAPGKLQGMLSKANSLGLKVILFASPQPTALKRLIKALGELPENLRPLALYLVDEPEIRSYSLERLLAAREALISQFPWVRLCTAMVRPEQVARYAGVYDAVFMDQYPVPTQPMNWLADSILMAGALVRPGGQVWAVLQGFGGGKFKAMGWPRLPTPQEVQALGASALVSGAQGMLVFTWRYFSQDPDLRQAFGLMSRRLGDLREWLPLVPGLPHGASLTHLGRVKTDPGGGPAVRTGWSDGPRGRLILMVNTTPYRAEVALSGVRGTAQRLWSKASLPAVGGQIRFSLEPLEVRAWLFPVVKNKD
ncbi:MAG: hypothetical protein KQI62_03305 [Deltaproteobacteria bacterium]|nr:hypothetical protein [Deltaproteobacteria bacterium]